MVVERWGEGVEKMVATEAGEGNTRSRVCEEPDGSGSTEKRTDVRMDEASESEPSHGAESRC